mmetsp:Transcript_26171/g.45009  ORF Transcript_26171/g.45009 Transcript_26171/m.45009 type:complete len:243 (-) Transcript_26171:346-1074(-)|eukprot:CAMPEP_0196655430 /NCGR_PEP_ID=MMETSP1086-20130531/5163_1 /TAXON_ID=77921 /ORGANISM="Cyanoptyche  gloeocystis , Strain SAG4.97" /LENGTH=242 /DNA_ID=CAMNT_0041987735 /DNA_START=72 /DNA_END=800 /DNA_ORIENTATION=+
MSATQAPVPESLLKKRKSLEKLKAEKAAKSLQEKKDRRQKRIDIFKRAEKYVAEYRKQELELVKLRRQAKKEGNYFLEPEPKLAFVIRIRGINQVNPRIKKILQLLRLRQINNGVFVKLNKATINMLRLVESYVTYGEPNLKSVRELIYKRGFGKVNKQRIPITDNSVIEGVLGKFNILCVEDLVHEIYTVGPRFKEASNFLWPFQLNSPKGGLVDKKIHFIEGGDAGFRSTAIDKLIRAMN